MKRTRVVLFIEGGALQWVGCNSEVDMDVLLLDADTDGSRENTIIMNDQELEATSQDPDLDAEYVDEAFSRYKRLMAMQPQGHRR